MQGVRRRNFGDWSSGGRVGHRNPRVLVLAFLLVVSVPLLVRAQALAPASSPAAKSSSAAAAPQNPPPGYVGSEVCKVCHNDNYTSFEKTPHWKTTLDTRRGPAFEGCEACHGPGAEHVASGGDKSKIFVFKGAAAADVTAR